MPSPMNVEPPPDGFEPSPVPAYSVPSEPRASAPIDCVKSSGYDGVKVTPPSVLFMIPPPLETAANTVLGVVVGSIATSMTPPPTFVGPANCQRVLLASGSAAAWADACLTCASVTGPLTDDARSSID